VNLLQAARYAAPVAQLVEHVLGKDEASGSKPLGGFFRKIKSSVTPLFHGGGAQRSGIEMRETIHFQCTECSRINYNSTKDKKQNPERLELKKFCAFCRKRTPHKETKK
jgi:large subunit ribosomal protein L33